MTTGAREVHYGEPPMADLTPEQEATRSRFEGLIALAAPVLDVFLAIGERVSRIAEPTDHEYYPIQPGQEPAQLPRPRREAPQTEVEADGTISSTAEEIGPDEPV
jgi:hypothetical protein